MTENLVIVESPAKARTLKKYLGENFTIAASAGHVKDLPSDRLAVDIDNEFQPEYVVIDDKKKIISHIRRLAKKADSIYLATDPDREGEAIAWHIADELGKDEDHIYRALFHEITKNAVQEAIEQPTRLHRSLFEAQKARRVLDRLVGYKISPLLWQKVRKGLSAGRVQSVAVKLIAERERAIREFVPLEYWNVHAHVEAQNPPPFVLRLTKINDKKPEIRNEKKAQEVLDDIKGAPFVVSAVQEKETKRYAPPPFITSTLQQEAARKLRFSVKRTMSVAQKLYEGIEIGDIGAVGLITYMRTDSVRISNLAISSVRKYIEKEYGKEFLPRSPHRYKNKRSAQDAHEAIRPSQFDLPPEKVKDHLTREMFSLYKLIWERFLACQMEHAKLAETQIESKIKQEKYLFSVKARRVIFPGFLKIYEEGKDNGDEENGEAKSQLPAVKEGEKLTLEKIVPEQKFTEPPPRFTESALVRELEKQGIGRPSTYAAIISTIQNKDYVEKVKSRFKCTELGEIVTDLLERSFSRIMDVHFTALMEEQLDKIEEGKINWIDLLKNFYDMFSVELREAEEKMRNIKRELFLQKTNVVCEKCNANMVIRWGRNGRFLACPNFPRCRNTKEYVNGEDGSIQVLEDKETDVECEKCGRKMIIKQGRNGRFLACPGYPSCKNIKPFSSGVKCPMEECKGDLVERRSKRGKTFYACSMYPKCKYVVWDKPLPRKCPKCAHPFLVHKVRKTGEMIACPDKECDYKEQLVREEEDD